MKKLLIVLGTRPEIMKNYSTVKAARQLGIETVVYHTNQHFDANMTTVFFEEMGYKPRYIYGGGQQTYRFGAAVDDVMKVIGWEKPDVVLTNGDTAASLVGALSAMYTDTPMAHVEAGLRSYDPEMYEERNRIMVDAIANFLFSYTGYQAEYLKSQRELRGKGKVFNVGNTTRDLIEDFSDKIKRQQAGDYVYMTLHRKELTDRIDVFKAVLGQINDFSAKHNIPIIWPLHPRSKDVLGRNNVELARQYPNITVFEPVDAFKSLGYEKYAKLMITDSGCIQEEVCMFGVPCVTVRDNTERPETIDIGANVLSGFDKITEACETQLANDTNWVDPYGRHGVGKRIVKMLEENL